MKGKVVRLIEKGLLAELPDGVDGFVPMSQLSQENMSKPAEHYQIDDVLELSVIEFNKESKKIVLSERKQGGKATAKEEKSDAEEAPVEDTVATEAADAVEDVVAEAPVEETAAEETPTEEPEAEADAESKEEEK